MARGCVVSGHRGAGKAQAAEAAFAGFMVLTVGAVQMVMTGLGRMLCFRVVALHVRHMGLHCPAQKQLQNQNHENDRAGDTHNERQYPLE